MTLATFLTACGSDEWVPTPMPEIAMQCFDKHQPVAWSYCVNRVEGHDPRRILYYFHGRNGAATWWNDETYYTADVQRSWKKTERRPPLVVSVSFGKLWLLTDTPDPSEINLFRTFAESVQSTIEQELGEPVVERMLVGESMGGFNALLVGLRAGSGFSKVASLCPPLPTISPFASLPEKIRYVRGGSISWQKALLMISFARTYFKDEKSWADNNPLELARRLEATSAPRFYLSCGAQDSWGCMEGSVQVVESIRTKGAHMEWHPRPGGHCDIDASSLAEFLVPQRG